MDSTSISNFISTLVVNSIIMTAFSTIDGFHDEFMDFILETLGDSVDILSLQLHLQDLFLEILPYELKYRQIDAFFGIRSCHRHGFDCDTFSQCVSLNPRLWRKAFGNFKINILSEINMRSASLSWALDNIPDFRAAVDEYMAGFAKVHSLCPNSIAYTEHFAGLKNDLQTMMDHYIETHGRSTHYHLCQGSGDPDYLYDLKSYEFCTFYCIPNQENQWKVLLDEWILSQREYNAISADRSANFDEPDVDFKESLRRDFTKNTKNVLRDTKRRLRKKGKL
jgi:hypothetical protein